MISKSLEITLKSSILPHLVECLSSTNPIVVTVALELSELFIDEIEYLYGFISAGALHQIVGIEQVKKIFLSLLIFLSEEFESVLSPLEFPVTTLLSPRPSFN
jgi:hypothetical protein